MQHRFRNTLREKEGQADTKQKRKTKQHENLIPKLSENPCIRSGEFMHLDGGHFPIEKKAALQVTGQYSAER
jgi:hypothetical protein